MARQQAAQRPLKSERTVVGSSPTLIRFDPELAVQAIVFHLADEGIASQVTQDSAQATRLRLTNASIRPSVEQGTWSAMTHPQRLEWLLDKTKTVARLISDEVSVLEPAKG